MHILIALALIPSLLFIAVVGFSNVEREPRHSRRSARNDFEDGRL
jgi:hypothetical protein